MPAGVPRIVDIEDLEERYQKAFATGSGAGLEIIGYGEISSVILWPTPDGPAAVKRLPDFRSYDARASFRELFFEYLERLGRRSVPVLPTDLVDCEDGPVAYAVQPAIDASKKAERIVQTASAEEAGRLIRRVFAHTCDALDDRLLGFDAQLSNWMVDGSDIWYVDVTTPFVKDVATGLPLLDTSVFVASLPWLLRTPVQRWLVPSIVNEYYDLRIILVNFLANMIKERTEHRLAMAVGCANELVDDPISEAEVRKYYASDARMWALLQRLRRMDRAWQLKVRRRPYPVLLPGKIER